jgi:FK506-binding protein 2
MFDVALARVCALRSSTLGVLLREHLHAHCVASSCSGRVKERRLRLVSRHLPTHAWLRTHKQCERKSAVRDEISTHYTGWLRQNGVVFDSSVSRGMPYTFTLGTGQVIQGWENGLVAMCVGERRRLTVPSDLGYGTVGSGTSVPPGATLVYDIELLRIKGPDGKEEL